jgi:hypothetical protein
MSKRATVLGVLSIVFGFLCAAYTVVTLFVMPAMMDAAVSLGPTAPQQQVMLAAANDVFRGQRAMTLSMSAPFVVMSLALVAVGIGLYRRRTWGRTGAIAWAWLGIVVLIVLAVVNVTYVHPEMTRISTEAYARHGAPIHVSPSTTLVFALFGYAFYLPFPIVLLALLAPKKNATLFS